MTCRDNKRQPADRTRSRLWIAAVNHRRDISGISCNCRVWQKCKTFIAYDASSRDWHYYNNKNYDVIAICGFLVYLFFNVIYKLELFRSFVSRLPYFTSIDQSFAKSVTRTTRSISTKLLDSSVNIRNLTWWQTVDKRG